MRHPVSILGRDAFTLVHASLSSLSVDRVIQPAGAFALPVITH